MPVRDTWAPMLCARAAARECRREKMTTAANRREAREEGPQETTEVPDQKYHGLGSTEIPRSSTGSRGTVRRNRPDARSDYVRERADGEYPVPELRCLVLTTIFGDCLEPC